MGPGSGSGATEGRVRCEVTVNRYVNPVARERGRGFQAAGAVAGQGNRF